VKTCVMQTLLMGGFMTWLEGNCEMDKLFCFGLMDMVVKEARVTYIGSSVSGQWVWRLRWRRPLFACEEELVNELETTLEGVG